MRPTSVLLTFFYVLILMLITSCSNDSVELHELEYQMTTWNQAHPDCTEDDVPCVSLEFLYPEFRGSNILADSLQAWTLERVYGPETNTTGMEAQILAEEWFHDYDQFAETIDDYRIPWSLERKVELIYQSNQIISLHFNEFSFTGGTHPVQIDLFQSFEDPGGRKITLSDLTTDDSHYQKLESIAEEQFRFTYELLDDEDFEDTGYRFLDGEFQLSENFAFTEYGILFYYNVYEIAPHTTRPIAIELPYSDLRNIVRSRWLKYEEQFAYR